MVIFGDSMVDVGNNNYLDSIGKANAPPYGRDFKDHVATGRYCNGKVTIDIIADRLGFSTYPAAYLSPQASGQNLLIGANFASGGSGFYDDAPFKSQYITLSQQLEYFQEYRLKLAVVAGGSSDKAQSIVSDALYIICTGSNDFHLNYYINPVLLSTLTYDQYCDRLTAIFSSTVAELYDAGARRIGVVTLPPMGCFPVAMTVAGLGAGRCMSWLNNNARRFNRKMSTAVDTLSERYHDLKIAHLDIYTPISGLVASPRSQGFTEAKRGCCGTGTVEIGALLCNSLAVGTCPDATTYVFWDGAHTTEAANHVIAEYLLAHGINDLVVT
uniref:Uncharacterized protein n=1 Tax=Avena sativa TaxID=4498 RepID=A0ACD5TYK5_AVESA